MFTHLKTTSFCVAALIFLFFVNPARGGEANENIKLYFSPNGNCEKAIIEEIEKAKSSIHIAIFNFTNGRIARALVRACRQGIDVKVVMDRERASEVHSKGRFLENKGIGVKLKKGPSVRKQGDETGLMHNKFAVIDGKVAITGSYNWTSSAEKWNYENLLIIPSVRVAELFEEEFRKLWIK
ncbi:MAG: phospholipase D family protein [Pseudomonadota bacterium]